MPKAAIFDLDGTLLDSVDLHAMAWHEAMVRFGHDVSFEQARGQTERAETSSFPSSCPRTSNGTTARNSTRGAPSGSRIWLSAAGVLRSSPCPICCGAPAMPGLRIAVASSAKRDELDNYFDIADITELVDVHDVCRGCRRVEAFA